MIDEKDHFSYHIKAIALYFFSGAGGGGMISGWASR